MKDRSGYAEMIHNGNAAHDFVEDSMESLWPELVCRISTDSYDNSLEVDFAITAPADLTVTPKQVDTVLSFGFSRCWLNFTDSTEQYFTKEEIYPRKHVEHPHWTAEMAEREMGE